MAAERGVPLIASDFLNVPSEEEDLNPAGQEQFGPAAIPKATYWGELIIGEARLPSDVLSNGARVFSLKGVVVALEQASTEKSCGIRYERQATAR